MKKRLQVLVAFDIGVIKPRGYGYEEEFKGPAFATERDVLRAIRDNGWEARTVGIHNDIRVLIEEVAERRPDVIFNLVEVFDNKTYLDKNVAAILEMLGIPYTGASSEALFLCNNKGLFKKVLRYHRLRGPRFQTFMRGHRVWLPKVLTLPCVVKPLCEEASRGISEASVVDNEAAFIERVRFLHEQMNSDAIAEEYVEGRELYVTVLGADRLVVFPPREFKFGKRPEDEPRIATYKAKWDEGYRKRWGIDSVSAGKLPNGAWERVQETCKRAYRALNLRSYARFDIRLTPSGQVVILEPNVNPCLAEEDEVGLAALKGGLPYDRLIRRIVSLALTRGGPAKKRRRAA